MKTLADALADALSNVGARVLWVGMEPPLAHAASAHRVTFASLPDVDGATFDAVVVGPVAPPLLERAREARGYVRAGGLVVLAVPIERDGLRALTQRALATFDSSKSPHALEDVCASLLGVGATRVKVLEVRGARGEAVVYGTLASD